MKTLNMRKFLEVMVVVFMITPLLVLGSTMKAGDEVSIAKGNDVDGNLYVAAGNVSINCKVLGDLYSAGGNVVISGNTNDDVVTAGGSVTILGNTGGDVRVAGGNVLVAGTVGGELIALGGSIMVSSNVSVGKDTLIAGGQVTLDGTYAGDVKIYGGTATINGHIKGNLIASVQDKLTIGDGAVIDGGIAYKAKNAEVLTIAEGAVVTGGTTFEKMKVPEKVGSKNVLIAFVGAFLLFRLFATLVTALILTSYFKGFSNTVVRGVIQNPLRMLGYGFVTVVVTPVAATLLFVTLLGIPLGFMVMLSYAFLMCVSCIYVGVVFGSWVSQLLYTSDIAVVTWKNVIGGVVLLSIVSLIPVVGWIVGLGVFLMSVGAIVSIIKQKIW